MTPWIVTKRRDRDFLVHRVGELRGICTTWEQDHANRIAAALNTAPFPGTEADANDKIRIAGCILAETASRALTHNGDIPIANLVQLTNALSYWSICSQQINKENQNG
jgi:hypothetical protein